jgi:hypothetical protein
MLIERALGEHAVSMLDDARIRIRSLPMID